MSTTIGEQPTATAPQALVNITSKEELIRRKLDEERARLEREMGLETQLREHFKRPVGEPVHQEPARAHHAALRRPHLEAREADARRARRAWATSAEAVPDARTSRRSRLGKEYGNNGQCNPTYFTVGNLVQYLQTLEEQGHDDAGDHRQLRLRHRRRLRAVPLRHVRGRVPPGAAQLPASTASACCSSSSRAASTRPTPRPGLEMNLDFFLAHAQRAQHAATCSTRSPTRSARSR